jgi:hypothetical protein
MTSIETIEAGTTTDLAELRRQRAEARESKAYYQAQYLKYARRGYGGAYRCDPAIADRREYWELECARLTRQIQALAPNPYLPLLKAVAKAAERPLAIATVAFAVAGIAIALPALLVAAAVVIVALLPWYLIGKLSNR